MPHSRSDCFLFIEPFLRQSYQPSLSHNTFDRRRYADLKQAGDVIDAATSVRIQTRLNGLYVFIEWHYWLESDAFLCMWGAQCLINSAVAASRRSICAVTTAIDVMGGMSAVFCQ